MKDLPDKVIFAAAPSLCLLAPILAFLTSNHYPLLSRESLPLLALGAVPGCIAFVLAFISRDVVATGVVWVAFLFAVVLKYDIFDASWVLALVLGSGLIVWLTRRHAATLIATAAGVQVGVTMAHHLLAADSSDAITMVTASRSAALPNAGNGGLPPILHIVLGELEGLNGLPPEIPGSHEVGKNLSDLFLTSGFTVFPNAYSQYSRMADSLSNLLNFESTPRGFAFVDLNADPARLTLNRYFERLQEVGYELNVYQSDLLNFCKAPTAHVGACATYEANTIESIRPVEIDAWQKSRFIWNSLIDSSATIGMLRAAYLDFRNRHALPLPEWPAGNSRTGPLALVPTMATLRERLRTIGNGEAYFVHLLTPQSPYVYKRDCAVRPKIGSWLNRTPFDVAGAPLDEANGPGGVNSPEQREERYLRYLDQVTCMQKQLETLFAALRESGQWERALIIVHGDHGARIFRQPPTLENRLLLTRQDFRDAYSAFYAAKSPYTPAGVDESLLPLQVLLARTLNLTEPDIEAGFVYLIDGASSTLERIELGDFDHEKMTAN